MLYALWFLSQAQSSHLPHLGGADVHFTGILDCFRQMIRNKGVFSLWSGFTANTVKVRMIYAADPRVRSHTDCLA